MKKSKPLQSHEYIQEKPVIHIGTGRRLPPIPIPSTRILSSSHTVSPTVSSRATKSMNNSVNSEHHFAFQNIQLTQGGTRSYDDNLPVGSLIVHSDSRKLPSYGTKMDQSQSHNTTPHIAA
uniref:Ovule protein n=1 Tax=Elaeophora elaphi TaxID=1147741 RepID=A0A0R3RFW8_9BILA